MALHLYDDDETGEVRHETSQRRRTAAAGRASLIWAWLAVTIVPLALDLVVDLTERVRYVPGYHGLNPTSYDYVLSVITGIGGIGLLRELFAKSDRRT